MWEDNVYWHWLCGNFEGFNYFNHSPYFLISSFCITLLRVKTIYVGFFVERVFLVTWTTFLSGGT